jgi:hypothetical protein
MTILIALTLLIPLAYADFATVRAWKRQQVSWGWWIAFGFFFLIGCAAGVWCGCFFRYQCPFSATLRVFSFPVPAGFSHFEDGIWMDYITPVPMFTVITNVLIIALSSVGALSIVYLIWGAGKKLAREHKATGGGKKGV